MLPRQSEEVVHVPAAIVNAVLIALFGHSARDCEDWASGRPLPHSQVSSVVTRTRAAGLLLSLPKLIVRRCWAARATSASCFSAFGEEKGERV